MGVEAIMADVAKVREEHQALLDSIRDGDDDEDQHDEDE